MLCWYCSRETHEGDIEFGGRAYHLDCFDQMWKELIGQNDTLRLMGESIIAKGEALIEALERGDHRGYAPITEMVLLKKAIDEYPKLIHKTPEVK